MPIARSTTFIACHRPALGRVVQLPSDWLCSTVAAALPTTRPRNLSFRSLVFVLTRSPGETRPANVATCTSTVPGALCGGTRREWCRHPPRPPTRRAFAKAYGRRAWPVPFVVSGAEDTVLAPVTDQSTVWPDTDPPGLVIVAVTVYGVPVLLRVGIRKLSLSRMSETLRQKGGIHLDLHQTRRPPTQPMTCPTACLIRLARSVN